MRRFSLPGVLLGAALVASPAIATPVLDQSNLPVDYVIAPTGPHPGMITGHEIQQQVTVGITGTLTEIDLWLGKPPEAWNPRGQVQFSLTSVIGGHSDGTWLGTRIIETTEPADTTSPIMNTKIDLSDLHLEVVAGQSFVFDLARFSYQEGVGGSDTDYPGGDLFIDTRVGAAWLGYRDWGNLAFQTFVDPIPEPVGIAILGFGLIALGLFRDRTHC
jgi:hypothetical protein